MPIMPGFRIHRTSVPIDNNRAKVPRYIVNQYNCISNSGVEFMRRRLSGRWLHGRDGMIGAESGNIRCKRHWSVLSARHSGPGAGCTIECVESIRYFSVGDAASFDGARSRIIHRTNETNQANYTVLKTRISLQVFARDASTPTSLRPWNEQKSYRTTTRMPNYSFAFLLDKRIGS